MRSNWPEFAGALVVATSLAAAVSVASADVFGDWDAHRDAGIDHREFATGFGKRGIYESWDADRNGALSRDEFDAGLFGRYDRDRNGRIEEPEFGDLNGDVGDAGLWDV